MRRTKQTPPLPTIPNEENGAPNPRLFGLDVETFAISPDGKWMVASAQQRLWLIDLELHIKADVPLQFSDPENIPPYVECLNPESSEFFETGRSFDLRKLAFKRGLHTMCYDVDGTLLFVDKYLIRRITEDRTVKPAAGHYGCGWEDGPATTHAKFFSPRSIVCDKDSWYVLDQNREGGFTARQVTRTSDPVVRSVATVTMKPREDNVAKFALCPSTGNLYLSLNCKGDILRRCPGQTSFETIASSTTHPEHIKSDTTGFYRGIAVDGAGNVVVVDNVSHSIYSINPSSGYCEVLASETPTADNAPFHLHQHGSCNYHEIDMKRGDLYYITGDRLMRLPGCVAKRKLDGVVNFESFAELLDPGTPTFLSSISWEISPTVSIPLHWPVLAKQCPSILSGEVRAKIARQFPEDLIRAIVKAIYTEEPPIDKDTPVQRTMELLVASKTLKLWKLVANVIGALKSQLGAATEPKQLIAHLVSASKFDDKIALLVTAQVVSKRTALFQNRTMDLVAGLSDSPAALEIVLNEVFVTAASLASPAQGLLDEMLRPAPTWIANPDDIFLSGEQSDFNIIVEGDYATPITCHSSILYCRWPFFRLMIRTGLREASERILRIGGGMLSRTTLVTLIRWMYNPIYSVIEPLSLEQCEEVLAAKEYFQLAELPLIEHVEARLAAPDTTVAPIFRARKRKTPLPKQL